jgi:hypothetical protein
MISNNIESENKNQYNEIHHVFENKLSKLEDENRITNERIHHENASLMKKIIIKLEHEKKNIEDRSQIENARIEEKIKDLNSNLENEKKKNKKTTESNNNRVRDVENISNKNEGIIKDMYTIYNTKIEQHSSNKTKLEIAFYHRYVLEKKKNIDFPEEKLKICNILPRTTLTIGEKILLGETVCARYFNNYYASPKYVVNIEGIYVSDNNIFIICVNAQYNTSPVMQIYNSNTNTVIVSPSLHIRNKIKFSGFNCDYYETTNGDENDEIRINKRDELLSQLEK